MAGAGISIVVNADGIDDESFAAPRPMMASNTAASASVGQGQPRSSSCSDSFHRQQADLGDVLVISGGSGYNDLVGATPGATFVMPISDDGGSSSEIIRVLGGPSIGDLRSRLIRLIPTSTSHAAPSEPPPKSNDALHALLSYRLPTEGRSRDIKQEWMDILEGRHPLWRGIEPERKECIRGFLVHFESEILRRVHRNFDFHGGSIGNFFLAAAQKFFRSIQSAIFLFSATALIPSTAQGGKVLPVINTNHTATIAAVLEDGRTIVGQCEISHPSPQGQNGRSAAPRLARSLPSGMLTPASVIFDPFQTAATSRLTVGNMGDGLDPGSESDMDKGDSDEDEASDGNTGRKGGEGPVKRQKRSNNLVFSKSDHNAQHAAGTPANGTSSPASTPNSLGSKIARLFYVNAYGNEVDPAPNPEYLANLHRCRTLLYSCGSLWTSIVPCLALRGIASAICSSPSLQYKILLLNTTPDRETWGLDAIGFVRVIARSMQHSDRLDSLDMRRVVTHVVYSPQGSISIDVAELEALGIRCVPVQLPLDSLRFDERSVREALKKISGQDAVAR